MKDRTPARWTVSLGYNPPTSVLFGPNFMASKLYQLSPLEDLTLAITLVGHVGIFNDESIKAAAVTNEKYGLVHRVYILCGKDNALEETSKSGRLNTIHLMSKADFGFRSYGNVFETQRTVLLTGRNF